MGYSGALAREMVSVKARTDPTNTALVTELHVNKHTSTFTETKSPNQDRLYFDK